jgi:hypothetical protein
MLSRLRATGRCAGSKQAVNPNEAAFCPGSWSGETQ